MTRKYRARNDLNRSYADIYPYVDTSLNFQAYRMLMIDMFCLIMKEIIFNKREWKLPFQLGKLRVCMRKKPADKQPVNWHEAKKQRKPLRFKNLHTSKYIFVFMYSIFKHKNHYSSEHLSIANVYNFHTSRIYKKLLYEHIKTTSEDPYLKTYSVPYETPNNIYTSMHR